MKKSSLLIIACLFLIISCKTSKTIVTTEKRIVAGSGVQGVEVGDKISDVLKKLGKPSKDDENYYYYYNKGTELYVESDKVKTVFIYFLLKKYKPYNGKTEKGINKESSIADVTELYGQPEHIGQSIISSGSDFAGQEDYNLNYLSAGITFTFYDKRLADIRVYKKK